MCCNWFICFDAHFWGHTNHVPLLSALPPTHPPAFPLLFLSFVFLTRLSLSSLFHSAPPAAPPSPPPPSPPIPHLFFPSPSFPHSYVPSPSFSNLSRLPIFLCSCLPGLLLPGHVLNIAWVFVCFSHFTALYLRPVETGNWNPSGVWEGWGWGKVASIKAFWDSAVWQIHYLNQRGEERFWGCPLHVHRQYLGQHRGWGNAAGTAGSFQFATSVRSLI